MDCIKNLTYEELGQYFISEGSPSYRASQVFDGLYSKNYVSFSQFGNLPLTLRESLSEGFTIDALKITERIESPEGSQKFLFETARGFSIESVLIPELDDDKTPIRNTLCVSSQAGCTFNCTFCATGKLKFNGNLSAGEIVDQYLLAVRLTGRKISNVVFMGMGEPLMNLNSVADAVRVLTSKKGCGLSRKKITISTVGLVPGIIMLADKGLGVRLALSLHSAVEEKRNFLIPSSKKWDLKSLAKASDYYYRKSGEIITLEYILFDGFNDSVEDIKSLAAFSRNFPSKINLIKYNDISFSTRKLPPKKQPAIILKAASPEKTDAFAAELVRKGVRTTVRISGGSDIKAACGQLSLEHSTAF